jgi:4-hydroxybenzoate polyprenyltransferase
MTFKTFLSLVRIPTVFSSMSNAYAGYFIAGGRTLDLRLPLGITAAALFIMAGMALNDVADREVDAQERPNRPIPSGAISLRGAWTLSLLMMGLGLILLALANVFSLVPGVLLCGAIVLYNFALKKSAVLGPLSMGLCRLLNLLTGMSLAWDGFPAVFPAAALGALFSLWAYIALVTYLARDEVQGNSRLKAKLFLSGITVWFMGWSLAIWLGHAPGQGLQAIVLGLVWVGHVLFLMPVFRNLARDPSPKHTGKTVGAMLRTVPMADCMAMLACGAPPVAALLGLLWILPAWLVGKVFYST